MADFNPKAALPDDIAVALDHGAITERDAADEMTKRLRAAVAEVERLRADVRQFERAASEILDDAQWFDEHHDDDDEASDRAHRIIQRVLGLFVGRELPGPWAFDKLLDERNELRGDVERLQGQAAAMREVLGPVCAYLDDCGGTPNTVAAAVYALAPEAARALIAERDRLRSFAESFQGPIDDGRDGMRCRSCGLKWGRLEYDHVADAPPSNHPMADQCPWRYAQRALVTP